MHAARQLARVFWHPKTTPWLAVPAFGLIGASVGVDIVPARTYGLLFALPFAWLGVLTAELIARATAASNEARQRAAENVRIVGRTVTAVRGLDPEAVLEAIVDGTIALGYDVAGLSIIDEASMTYTGMHLRGTNVSTYGPFPIGNGMTGTVWEKRLPVIVDDYRDVLIDGAPPPPTDTRTIAAIPVFADDALAAVLIAGLRTVHPIHPEDVAALQVLADNAGDALVTIRGYEAYRERAERRERINRAIIDTQRLVQAASLDTNDLLRVVCEQAAEITGATGGVVELVESDEIVYRAASGSALASIGMRVPLRGSISGLAVGTDAVLLCDDTELDDRVNREACRRLGIRSMIVVPLHHTGRTAGVLKVVSDRTFAFEEQDIDTLEQLGDFISDSINIASAYIERVHDADHDELTGLLNRRALATQLDEAFAQGGLTVLFLDLDGFKGVNDTHGHDVGDELLRAVGRGLADAVRITDHVGRLGGDEFVVMCRDADRVDIVDLEDRIRSAVDQAVRSLEVPVRVGVSIGVAWQHVDTASAKDLVGAADAAMYASKQLRHAGID